MGDEITTVSVSRADPWRSGWFTLGVLAAFILVFGFLFGRYLAGTLSGNLAWHVLPSAYFGPPDVVATHGFVPMYTLKIDGGWDGQQYYYASNDIFDRYHTADILDGARAIRYSRVGVGLVAGAVSRILGYHWIPATIYFYANFGIVLLGLIFLLWKWGGHKIAIMPAIAIFFFPGVYLTVFNGLPDAAADALFIIVLVSFCRSWWPIAVLAGVLCVLCREAYALIFGAMFGMAMLLRLVVSSTLTSRCSGVGARLGGLYKPSAVQLATLLAPAVSYASWQVWLRIHFGYWASTQAGDVVDRVPLRSLIENMWLTWHRHPRVVPPQNIPYEKAMLIIFSLVLLCGLIFSLVGLASLIKRPPRSFDAFFLLMVCTAGLAACVLYSFLGNTVMEHYSGYLKDIGLLFLVVSLVMINLRTPSIIAIPIAASFVAFSVISCAYVWKDRISEQFPHHFKALTSISEIESPGPMRCVGDGSIKTRVVGLSDTNKRPWLRDLFLSKKFEVATVAVENGTKFAIGSSEDPSINPLFIVGETKWSGGASSASYRSVLRQPIPAGAMGIVNVLVEMPISAHDVEIRPIVVQPNCPHPVVFTPEPFDYADQARF